MQGSQTRNVLFRGDYRADKFGSSFKKGRASSGRFYFTDDPDIASSYAKNKPDHALIEQNNEYGRWFRISTPAGEVDLNRAWYSLTQEQRAKVRDVALRARRDEETGAVVMGEPDGGIAGLDHWQYEVESAQGDWLKAMKEVWLNSGSLFNEERQFGQILDAAGLRHAFDSPHDPASAVSPFFVNIRRPLIAESPPPDVVEAIRAAARHDRTRARAGHDQWDKQSISFRDWVRDRFESSLSASTETARGTWATQIPEKAVSILKSLGYDGIRHHGGVSTGGKRHSVWIAFEPTQIKSATGNSGKFDPAKRNVTGAAHPAVVGALGSASFGGAGGGVIGAQIGNTPEERRQNALILAALGAGVGGTALIRRARTGGVPKSPHRSTTGWEAPGATRTPTEHAGPSGARQPIGTPTQGRLFNRSLQSLDPEGRRMWEIEEAKLVEQGEVKRRVTDAEVRAFAKDVDIPTLTRSDASKLNTTELMALGTRIKEDRATYDALMTRMEKEGATFSREAKEDLSAEMDAALGRLVGYDRVLNRAGSEQGRGLRILGKIAAGRGTLEAATHTARRVLGVPELGADVTDALANVMRDPTLATGNAREEALARVIQSFQSQPLYRVVLDVRRWSMLTALATHAVNITGSIVEGVNRNAIVTPTAAALDRAWSAITGASRSVSTRGRGTGLGRGIVKGGRAIDRRYFQGIDPEDPLMTLNRQRTDYVASLGLSERDGTEAWRSTLAAGARVLQKSGDIVYGMMTVPDKIFYTAALNASLMERSGLRAVREGLSPGTAAFKQRVVELMKPENVSTTDATMALMEALDDVFKTPTKASWLVRSAGPAAEWFVPYATTPTNLARKALESTPGIGLAINGVQVRKLKAKLAQLDVPAEDIAREVRRSRITNLSKQLSTGAGMIMAGFVLTTAGRMTGDYVPPMGMDDEERDEASKRRLTDQGPLTIKVGDKAYSLNAFAQFAPLLAVGHALAMESKREAEAGDGDVVGRVAGRAASSAGRTIMDFPLLQGAKNATDFLSGERAGGLGRWAGREVASAVPYGAGVAAIARATDPIAKRDPETFGESIKERLPGLRRSVAPKVGPLGETTPRVSVLEGLVSPGRPQRVRTGPLYEALEETGTYPSAARRLEGETNHDYASRRQQEGEIERALLQDLLDGKDEAWAFLSPFARQRFDQTGDWNQLLRSALARQRTAITQQRKEKAVMSARAGQ